MSVCQDPQHARNLGPYLHLHQIINHKVCYDPSSLHSRQMHRCSDLLPSETGSDGTGSMLLSSLSWTLNMMLVLVIITFYIKQILTPNRDVTSPCVLKSSAVLDDSSALIPGLYQLLTLCNEMEHRFNQFFLVKLNSHFKTTHLGQSSISMIRAIFRGKSK